jgi:hypothetical protein
VSVPALEQELAGAGATKRETAEHERTGTKAEILLPLISLDSNQFNPIDLTEVCREIFR